MNFKNKKLVFGIFGFLFFANILAWIVVYDLSQQRFLEVTFFDVGQGDAIFIETPQGHQILVDGGPSSAILQKLAKEMPFYDRTIDLIILTHPEKDHLSGLLDVLKSYKVQNILWTGVIRETPEFKEWENLIKKENANIRIAKAGKKIIFPAKKESAYFEVLYPFEDLEGIFLNDSNDTSIVCRLVFGKKSFLLTGDITKKVEQELLTKEDFLLDSDILKISHHASKTSTSEKFVEAVSPLLAAIQVGKNNYGHPTPEILAVLQKFGIETLITKEVGDIKIISDGEKLLIVKN